MIPVALLALACGAPAGAATQIEGDRSLWSGPTQVGDDSWRFVADPAFTKAAARQLHRDPAFDGKVEGEVYARPLYLRGPHQRLLVVATEENRVYGLDAVTGQVKWQRRLGMPVAGRDLPCGNIDPLGVTGTPAEANGVVYLDAMTTPDGGKTKQHLLYALSASSGKTQPGWPIDVAAALAAGGQHFKADTQNQRAALAVGGGFLFVLYGGHYGDCGDYHGWVVGFPLADPKHPRAWSTPVGGGGIWGPGGPALDASGLYLTTGNTFNAREYADGESVLRFALDRFVKGSPEPADFFAPAEWKQLDDADLDLGGAGPLTLALPGAKPFELVAAFGKDGDIYLLDKSHLGGIGGQVARLHAVGNHGGIRGAAAAFTIGNRDGVTLVVNGEGAACPKGQSGDLTAVRASPGSPPTLTTLWCADSHGHGPPGGSPTATSPDGVGDVVVWNVGAEGDGRLHGFDGETGEVVFDGGGAAEKMGRVRHFQAPVVAAGRLYVAGDGRVYAFTPR